MKWAEEHISRISDISTYFPTDLSTETWRTHLFIDTRPELILRPLTSHLFIMVPPVDQRRVLGSTVHAKFIHVMAEAERNRLYGSQTMDK